MKLPLNVSILICARNEEKNLPGLLVSLANQTALENINEVLIADNSSTDKTIQVAQQIAETYDLPLNIYSLASNNLGYSRKLLVDQAKSDFVVFVDADCKVGSEWLQTLISHYSNFSKHNPRLAGVGGPNRLPGKNLFQKMINQNLNQGLLHGFSAQSLATKKRQGVLKDHLPTTNALFRKNALQDVGNFSPRFHRVGEDLDIGLRIKKSGGELMLFPSPTVVNDSSSDFTSWLKRMFRFGIAQGLTAGRRLAFVSVAVFAASAAIASLPFLGTEATLMIFALWLIFAGLACRPVKIEKPTVSHVCSSVASYFYAILTLTFTVLMYTLGFYWGLFTRMLPGKQLQTSFSKPV